MSEKLVPLNEGTDMSKGFNRTAGINNGNGGYTPHLSPVGSEAPNMPAGMRNVFRGTSVSSQNGSSPVVTQTNSQSNNN